MAPVQFPTASGAEAGKWCPTGKGDGTHVAGAGAKPAFTVVSKLSLCEDMQND